MTSRQIPPSNAVTSNNSIIMNNDSTASNAVITQNSVYPNNGYESTFIVMPSMLNSLNVLFGGFLISQMDLACITYLRKHKPQRIHFTTAIDTAKFIKPILNNDVIELYITHTDTASNKLTCNVTAKRLELNGMRTVVATALFSFVTKPSDSNVTEG